MMKKLSYISPEAEIIELARIDMLTGSDEDNSGNQGGSDEGDIGEWDIF